MEYMVNRKVTIIIPVYNSETTIKRCLESVCGQTYKNLEIILIDNNSTDNSKQICLTYADMDSRIVVLDERKQGPGAARNKGLKHGTGEVLCFVDADDVMCIHAVEEILLHFTEECDLVWFDFECHEINSKLGSASFLHENVRLTGDEVLEQAAANDLDSVLAVLWNKAFCYEKVRTSSVRFPENRKQGEDLAFVLRYLAQMKQPIHFIHKKLYEKYESHLTGIQENNYNMFRLTRDYFKDLNTWLAIRGNDASLRSYENIAAILADKLVLSFIRLHHPQAGFPHSYCWNIVKKVIRDKTIQKLILYYRPQKGQSKLIPVFVRMKSTFLLYLLGKYKAWYIYAYIRKEKSLNGL